MNPLIVSLRRHAGHLFILFMLVLLLCATFIFVPIRLTHATSFNWSLGSDVIDSQLNKVDIVPAAFHQGSTLWVI